jgi:hypothetical protein
VPLPRDGRAAGPGPRRAGPAIDSFFEDRSRREEQTRAAAALAGDWRGPGNLVMVTHQVNITALTTVFPASGETVVAARPWRSWGACRRPARPANGGSGAARALDRRLRKAFRETVLPIVASRGDGSRARRRAAGPLLGTGGGRPVPPRAAQGRRGPGSGFYRFKVGEMEVTLVNDGAAQRPARRELRPQRAAGRCAGRPEAAFQPTDTLTIPFTTRS